MLIMNVVIQSHISQMYSPIFIIPHEDVIVNSKPRSTDLRKNSHHAVTLHICKLVKLKLKFSTQLKTEAVDIFALCPMETSAST